MIISVAARKTANSRAGLWVLQDSVAHRFVSDVQNLLPAMSPKEIFFNLLMTSSLEESFGWSVGKMPELFVIPSGAKVLRLAFFAKLGWRDSNNKFPNESVPMDYVASVLHTKFGLPRLSPLLTQNLKQEEWLALDENTAPSAIQTALSEDKVYRERDALLQRIPIGTSPRELLKTI